MKHAFLLLLSVLAAATVAAPKQPTRVDADRLLAIAKHRVAKGDKVVASANKIRKESKRIRVLVRAKSHYRRARTLAQRAMPHCQDNACKDLRKVERKATRSLVDVLNTEAEFYFGRTSTGQAKKRNEEALALLPKNKRALVLARDIRNGANSGFVFGGRGAGRG